VRERFSNFSPSSPSPLQEATCPLIHGEATDETDDRDRQHGWMMKGVPNEPAEVSRDWGLGTCSVHHCEWAQDLSDVFRMGVL